MLIVQIYAVDDRQRPRVRGHHDAYVHLERLPQHVTSHEHEHENIT